MFKTVLALGLIATSAALLSCRKAADESPGPSSLTPREIAARFPSDLGPSTVNVSAYPDKIQEGYKVFLAACSACHTPARAVNSALSGAYDWKRYVHRMHVKSQSSGYVLSDEDEKKIVEFLVYDSNVRKVKDKTAFSTHQKALETVFEQVKAERERLILEETMRLPKKESVYTGTP